MLRWTDILPDTEDDIAGDKLLRVQTLKRWTGEKHRLVAELREQLARNGYIEFRADPRRYHLHRVGQSCRFTVPLTRRGKLERFRGQTVRLACVASGKFRVLLMAGPIGSVSGSTSTLVPDGRADPVNDGPFSLGDEFVVDGWRYSYVGRSRSDGMLFLRRVTIPPHEGSTVSIELADALQARVVEPFPAPPK